MAQLPEFLKRCEASHPLEFADYAVAKVSLIILHLVGGTQKLSSSRVK